VTGKKMVRGNGETVAQQVAQLLLADHVTPGPV